MKPRRSAREISRDANSVLRSEVAQRLAVGRVRPGPLAIELWDSHRVELSEWTDELAVTTIADRIRKLCKETIEQEESSLFPDMPRYLPRAICVPNPAANDDGNEVDREASYYVAVRRATVAEGQLARDGLTQQIEADTRRRDALSTVLRMAQARGAGPDDPLIV